ANLRKQLANGPPATKPPAGGDKPVPKIPTNIPPPIPSPNPKINPNNGATSPTSVDLSGMAPGYFADFISHCDDKELQRLLSAETGKPGPKQDSGVVAKLYKEISKRRKM